MEVLRKCYALSAPAQYHIPHPQYCAVLIPHPEYCAVLIPRRQYCAVLITTPSALRFPYQARRSVPRCPWEVRRSLTRSVPGSPWGVRRSLTRSVPGIRRECVGAYLGPGELGVEEHVGDPVKRLGVVRLVPEYPRQSR
eukprot:3940350-Rhodomonas_salina.3